MEVKMTKCPKCMSSNIFTKKKGVGWGKGLAVGSGSSMSGPVNWVTYLCTSCGYFENYLAESDWLTRIQADAIKLGWKKSDYSIQTQDCNLLE
jgi:predicted nucleic-acid-binding Zn-ribbon protein